MVRYTKLSVRVVCGIAFLGAACGSTWAAPVGTVFTYQGVLSDDGADVSDACDFLFSLWDDALAGTQVGSAVGQTIDVDNGLFTTPLDFGLGAFTGDARWLQIEVCCPAPCSPALILLDPRQELTPAPYALHAANAPDGHSLDAADGDPVDALFVDDNGNVGIGTTIPAQKLTVDGLLSVISPAPAPVGSTVGVGAPGGEPGIAINLGDGAGSSLQRWDLKVETDRSFQLRDSTIGNTRLTVTTNGDVGIGTDTPTEKLTVTGTVESTAGGFKFPDGTVQTTAAMTGGGNTLDGAYDEGGAGAGRIITADAGPVEIAGPDGLLVAGTIQSGSSIIIDGSAGAEKIISTDAIEIHTSSGRIMRLEPEAESVALFPGRFSPNILGGFQGNSLAGDVIGATIAGGGATDFPNRVDALWGTVGGGYGNIAGDGVSPVGTRGATVSGGFHNSASGLRSTVGGGENNTASGTVSTIGGGDDNIASGSSSTLGGGFANTASGTAATIGGGERNIAQADYATIAGGGPSDPGGDPDGTNNRVFDDYGTIGGGGSNRAGSEDGDSTNHTFATVGGGRNNIASSTYSTVGGGGFNSATGSATIIGGGLDNLASGDVATVAGGSSNGASGNRSTIGGGNANTASTSYATVGGGNVNTASGDASTVGGGERNFAQGDYATIAGGGPSNTSDALNTNNRVFDDYGTIGGGGGNRAGSDDANPVTAPSATVGGGRNNTASASYSTVAGGNVSTASGVLSAIGGGGSNTASGFGSTVGGGDSNSASGSNSTIGGGDSNTAGGLASTVPGGRSNEAAGDYSFAAGRRARANFDGSFVWGDSTNADVSSVLPNQFIVRATGGARFFTNSSLSTGVSLAAGGGSWSSISDRNVKRNIEPVDSRRLLERLSQVSIATWSYESQDESVRHIGPMAQDFHAAFAVGEDERYITAVDADGVALAAIQGLHEIVQEKDCVIAELAAENAEIKVRLERIEALMGALGGQTRPGGE